MNAAQNPFSISFGIPPARYISRLEPIHEILSDFSNNIASGHVFLITGVRGCGKTVLLASVSEQFEEDSEWIVIDLNPNRDMLQSLAGKLYGVRGAHPFFQDARLDLSAFGIGVSIKGAEPVTDIEAALFRMMEMLKEKKKKILITVDEVTNNANVRAFASSFQSMIRARLPVYLLMTGLYDNVSSLQDEKSLTFLYRARKIMLDPLNLSAVKNVYQATFDISEEMAVILTKLTKGYSFAFQVLGYLYWKEGGKEMTAEEMQSKIIPQYDQYLEEYCYEKIWAELHEPDRRVLMTMAKQDAPTINSVRTELEMSSQLFYRYKQRLLRKGILRDEDGRLFFVLPRFAEFIHVRELLYD